MSTTTNDTTLLDDLDEFLGTYYNEAIGELAAGFPSEGKSLYIDWNDLFRFDPALVDDFRREPEQIESHLEEALAQYTLPVDIDLAEAHVRVMGVPEHRTFQVGEYRASQIGEYLGIVGQVQKKTQVKPKPVVATFECQRCGTAIDIPQTGNELQEPHECSGCERQGPFRFNEDQSEWVDHQAFRVQLPPEQARGTAGAKIDVVLEDDVECNLPTVLSAESLRVCCRCRPGPRPPVGIIRMSDHARG